MCYVSREETTQGSSLDQHGEGRPLTHECYTVNDRTVVWPLGLREQLSGSAHNVSNTSLLSLILRLLSELRQPAGFPAVVFLLISSDLISFSNSSRINGVSAFKPLKTSD